MHEKECILAKSGLAENECIFLSIYSLYAFPVLIRGYGSYVHVHAIIL
jgi:hypothetical protein